MENEPDYVMDEAELQAYRQAGGPVDTYKNPIQYFGKRGALAGHIEQVDKYLQRLNAKSERLGTAWLVRPSGATAVGRRACPCPLLNFSR